MSTGINIAPSSDITVGTTPSTGTNGRVFFQAGGVVQQDANFTFDNTLKRLALKAVGTTATDIPFAVQNSAGSANLMQVAGDNTMTFLSSTGKIIFSQDTVGQGSVISLRRDFSNQEIIRLDGTNGGGITINPLNDGSVKSVAIGSVANGISMWTTGLTSHNFQIKNSFHNLFHVVGDPNSATATFRVGTTASNTNFFNVHGRNAGGTGLTTNPIFTINSSGTVGIGTEASTPGARLDVRAQGALSTDIAFRVRNSADNDNLIESAGNGLIKFRTGTERIEINTSASDYKMSLYKFGIEMTRLSTYSSYFCVGGSGQYLGVGTSGPSHLLDISTLGTQKQIVTRFGNDFNSTTQSDVALKFTTAYCGGGFGGNPLAYLTVGNNGGVGVNNNAKSYFKFELLKNNTLAERASITSQSNLLLQAPTEDTNDVGVIYIPNGTAPTVALAGGGKLYVEGGVLKYIGSSGTVTPIAPA